MKRQSQRDSDLVPEQLHIVLVDEMDLIATEGCITGCEFCVEGPHLPLDYLMDAVTGSNPVVTEYLFPRPARCPCCGAELTEKMSVRF